MTRAVRLAALALLVSGVIFAATARTPAPDQKKQGESLCRDAIALIKVRGTAAFAEFRKQGSKWLDEKHYVFVADRGLQLVNTCDPSSEGKSFWDYRDPSGRLVCQDQYDLVKGGGSAWYRSQWTLTGGKVLDCDTFVRGVTLDGKLLVVGIALVVP